MFRLLMVLACIAWADPDLKPTLSARVIGSDGPFDVVEVFTVVSNNGTSDTYSYTSTYPLVGIGIDSLIPLKIHTMPAGYVLGPGRFNSYLDTFTVIPHPFAITIYVDPIKAYDGYAGNNVTSQGYDFHPQLVLFRDTVVVYDTLRLRDTLKVVQRDTVSITLHDTTRVSVVDTIFQRDTIRVVVRDTVVKKDTVKYCPPTLLAKAGSLAYRIPIASVIYNAAGAKVWEGMLPPGAYPPAGLRPGLHLIVQGDKARRFRIAYR